MNVTASDIDAQLVSEPGDPVCHLVGQEAASATANRYGTVFRGTNIGDDPGVSGNQSTRLLVAVNGEGLVHGTHRVDGESRFGELWTIGQSHGLHRLRIRWGAANPVVVSGGSTRPVAPVADLQVETSGPTLTDGHGEIDLVRPVHKVRTEDLFHQLLVEIRVSDRKHDTGDPYWSVGCVENTPGQRQNSGSRRIGGVGVLLEAEGIEAADEYAACAVVGLSGVGDTP